MFSIRWTVGGNVDPFCYLFWTATWNRWNTSYRRRSPSRIHIQRQVRLVDLSITLFRTWENLLIDLDAVIIQFIFQGTMRMILIMDTAAIYYGDSGMRPGRLKWSILATDAERYVDGRYIIPSYLYYNMNIHVFVCTLVIIDFR